MVGERFEWDEAKARANERKHGVSFAEASSAFFDDDARVISDADHSFDEERFVLLGRSVRQRLLVVCHCYREGDAIIRIISARDADSKETSVYSGYLT